MRPSPESAAELLDRALLVIEGDLKSSSFHLDVGLDGSLGGKLHAQVVRDRGKVKFSFGYSGQASDPRPVKPIFDALERHADDLLMVYYQSGHTVARQSVWRYELRTAPFDKWEFCDFSGVKITREKPIASGPQSIHDAIGAAGDESIFGWVARRYSAGWLVCDDGSGEVADFVHLARDGTLSFIHVKSAKSDDARRGVATAQFEVVVGQAVKNIRYLAPSELKAHLSAPKVRSPASWVDGQRVSTRDEFIQMLDGRLADDHARIVIVQPHLSKAIYDRLRTNETEPPRDVPNTLRLSLLETILNSARGTVVASGADLQVIGSM